jgi:membrane protein implicated in regulation of membrane protease activity
MLATDPLSLLFLGCALFAGLFLVASVALGAGHGHAGHLGSGHAPAAAHATTPAHTALSHTPAHDATPATTHGTSHGSAPMQGESLWGMAQSLLLGSLNLNGALIFLLVFGVLGYLLHNGQAASLLTVVALAALVGALAAIGVNAALTRIFITSQAGELSADSSRLEGRLASVSIAIRAQGIGEVVYSGEAGARQSIGARSADSAAIPTGTEVVIVAAEQGLATVQPWNSFLADTRQRLSADQSAPRLEPLAPAAPPGAEPPRGE